MEIDLTGIGSVANAAKAIANKFLPDKMSEADKAQAQLGIQGLLTERDNTVDKSRRDIIVAELNQGDNYTKRARPTIIYAGLVFIGLVHVVFPILKGLLQINTPELTLPSQFWWSWSGVSGIYALGRSAEKRGVKNKLVGMITGSGGL